MKAAFCRKKDHRTLWVELNGDAFSADDRKLAAAVGQALGKIGFEMRACAPPLPDGSFTQAYARPGSGPFRGWTLQERLVLEAQARKLLEGFGFQDAPVHVRVDAP